ncbi:hypothetical protein FH972_027191 [Carpinus fangiana]|uniref:Uncharacterized protein n=1 Tax=Carpinus fangiana TaxID=176857 RepID=A0A5N6L690_9ROSI|nr:hypothetical protein FH972_027191 [Carpinus fangiana]
MGGGNMTGKETHGFGGNPTQRFHSRKASFHNSHFGVKAPTKTVECDNKEGEAIFGHQLGEEILEA